SDIGSSSTAWNRTVLVGHSYGSSQAHRLAQLRPELIDALALTGFASAMPGFPYLLLSSGWTQAAHALPARFGNVSSHWLVPASQYADQVGDFYPPGIDPAAAAYARSTANTVAQGTFFSAASIAGAAYGYTGPAQVLIGARDFIIGLRHPYFPNGTDYATVALESLLPNARNDSVAQIVADSGHGIAFHRIAPKAFQATIAFLDAALG
ncbi:hypothetical protein OC835_002842, partial [Tilletia horrida]